MKIFQLKDKNIDDKDIAYFFNVSHFLEIDEITNIRTS